MPGIYPFVIWSFEHDAWWRPGRMRYTTELDAAGRYSEAEAREIVDNANRYANQENERALTLADALESGPPK